MKKVTDKLVECGLTDREAKIYYILCKSGPTKASVLARQLGLPRSELYIILKNLQNKGIVEATLERPMRFIAISFEKVMDNIIREEKKKMEEMQAILEKFTKRDLF